MQEDVFNYVEDIFRIIDGCLTQSNKNGWMISLPNRDVVDYDFSKDIGNVMNIFKNECTNSSNRLCLIEKNTNRRFEYYYTKNGDDFMVNY